MDETLHQLALGFLHLLTPANGASLVVGLVVGMLVAVLPGLTLVMGVVLALPFTYGMGVTSSIILLTAMYLAGTYGGAFTSSFHCWRVLRAVSSNITTFAPASTSASIFSRKKMLW